MLRFKAENGSGFLEWEMLQLYEILTERKERNKGTNLTEVFSVAKHEGVINQIEHLGRSYASSDISNYKAVHPGDLIYTKSPTSDFPFGIIKQNKLDRVGVVSVLYGIFEPKTRSLGFLLDAYFSFWTNTFNYLQPLVRKGAKNTLNIGNGEFLKGALIYLPVDEKEQQKIASFLTTLDEKINNAVAQITQTQHYKKALLQQLFN